jgi:DNA-binding winged helix-turn-helix (wHTH) protein/TolB-like protein/Flp pilus assembly protein TadD
MSSEIKHLRQFGKFRLDVQKRVLWHDGEPVDLPLKEIELLCVLTESHGELVTKDDLLKKVWSDSFVEESNLSRHIYLLRKTFKDFGENEELIQTVPRRGYRFAGEVKQCGNGDLVIEKHTLTQTLIEEINNGETAVEEKIVASQDSALAARKPRFGAFELRSGVLAAAALFVVSALSILALLQYNKTGARNPSAIKSIAVLPFRNLTVRSDGDHSGLGIADLLITRLSNIREVNVRPTSAVMAFEGQETDSVSAGRRLEVDAVLEGTLYRAADRVRVTTRLVRVSDQSPIWAEHFETPLADELRLEDEIALQVVDALALNLSDNEHKALTKRYTESADAYHLYIKGRYHWNKRNLEGLSEAERLFRNAIEKDPNFALAYVGLADTAVLFYRQGDVYRALGKALELDPNLAEAHATQGFARALHAWQWKGAEESFKKSIELNPGYATAHHWYATLLGIEGRFDEAKAEMQRALEINPLSHNFLADLGQIHYFAHEYDKAKEYCRKALEHYPDFVFAHEYLYRTNLQTGEYQPALDEMRKSWFSLHTTANQPSRWRELESSEYDEYDRLLKEYGIRKTMEHRLTPLQTSTDNPNNSYETAWIHAFLGDKEKALDNLEKAFENKAFLMAWVKADPVFDCLRAEPRYQAILRNMGLAS